MTNQKVVRPATMQDQTYRALRESIMAGEYRPGQRITTRGLADSFGTSSMPIREALSRLAAEGAVVASNNRYYEVTTMDRRVFEEVTRIRLTLEGLATRLATARMTAEKTDALKVICEKFEDATRNQDIDEFLRQNQNFHFSIYRYAEMPTLMRIIEGLWLNTGPLIRDLMGLESFKSYDFNTHRSILEALITRDEAKAESEVQRDIEQAAEEVLSSNYFN